MSNKEMELIKKITQTVPKLDKEKQNYILGLTEGMAIAKDFNNDRPQCVEK